MLGNPKTTTIGILLIASACVQVALHFLQGGTVSGVGDHIQEIITALAGAGLVAAKDGGR